MTETETGPWEVELPYTKPPLTLNARDGWAVHARKVKQLRSDTAFMGAYLKVPRDLGHCEVLLHYRPRTAHARDEDNLIATLKPCIDGLRDIGVFADDDSSRVRSGCRIEPRDGPPRLWLSITLTEEDA